VGARIAAQAFVAHWVFFISRIAVSAAPGSASTHQRPCRASLPQGIAARRLEEPTGAR
jgi:hypothetical protein